MGCCGDSSEVGDSSEKTGEPVKYDPTFNGPIKNRSCTDVICCILFIIFLVAFVAVGVWAFIMGDPKVLLYPSDSEGNICGYGDNEDKPYVFFFDLLDCAAAGPSVVAIGCPTPQICVEECPSEPWVWQKLHYKEVFTKTMDIQGRSRMICRNETDLFNASKVYHVVSA